MSSWEAELEIAGSSGNINKLKSILARNEVRKSGNLGRKEWKNYFPLNHAACHGREAIAKILVAAGVDVNSFAVGKNCRFTALHYAVRNNRVEMVRVLLELGADATVEGYISFCGLSGTPLDWAKKEGKMEMMRILEDSMAATAAAIVGGINSEPAFHQLDSLKKLQLKATKEQELNEALILKEELNINDRQIKNLKKKEKDLTNSLHSLQRHLEPLKRREVILQGRFNINADAQQIAKRNRGALKSKEELDINDGWIKELEEQEREINLELFPLLLRLEPLMELEDSLQDRISINIEAQQIAKKNRDAFADSLKQKPGYKSEIQLNELRDQLQEIQGLADAFKSTIKSECPICMQDVKQIFSCQICHNWVCDKCEEKLETCASCRQDLEVMPLLRNITTERALGI